MAIHDRVLVLSDVAGDSLVANEWAVDGESRLVLQATMLSQRRPTVALLQLEPADALALARWLFERFGHSEALS